MNYAEIERRLKNGGIVILDGGTGTELELRGVSMDSQAWCGPATLEHTDLLESIHRDYIAAGADIITANTFASSRLMLRQAGLAGRFEEINRAAVGAAHRARAASGRGGVAVAGSLSHMLPIVSSAAKTDLARAPSEVEMADAFEELAKLLRDEGCDLIILEMMYHPDRMAPAFKAATDTGLPVWAGFSARRGENGRVLGYASDKDIPFEETVRLLVDFEIAAAGVMHTPSDLVGDAIAIVRDAFGGPLIAYPDSGYFKMPQWQFKDIITPDELLQFAQKWTMSGVQVVGGCCGLSPEHIATIAPLKDGG
jgi:homocysteine S-methyltransferase